MKLHRSQGQPDWTTVESANRNPWQRVAAATHGLITPGNVATIAGFLLVIIGLCYIAGTHYLLGGSLIVIGRLMDIVDGWLAELTGTKSPIGEAMDAAADKIITFLAIVFLLVSHLAPLWVLFIVALPHIVISLIVLVARRRNKRLHPSRNGKTSMVLAWAGLVGIVFLGLQQFDNPITQVLTAALLAGSVILATVTALQYGKSIHQLN